MPAATSVSKESFGECPSIAQVRLTGSTAMYDHSQDTYRDAPWYEAAGPVAVEIADGVTNISDYAFSECAKLTSVTIPHSVRRIGAYAFFWMCWNKGH